MQTYFSSITVGKLWKGIQNHRIATAVGAAALVIIVLCVVNYYHHFMAPKAYRVPVTAAGNAFGGVLFLSALAGCSKKVNSSVYNFFKTKQINNEEHIQTLIKQARSGDLEALKKVKEYMQQEKFREKYESVYGEIVYAEAERCLDSDLDTAIKYYYEAVYNHPEAIHKLKALAESGQESARQALKNMIKEIECRNCDTEKTAECETRNQKMAAYYLGTLYEKDFLQFKNKEDFDQAFEFYRDAAQYHCRICNEEAREAIFRIVNNQEDYPLSDEEYYWAGIFEKEKLIAISFFLKGAKKHREMDGNCLRSLKTMTTSKRYSPEVQAAAQEALQEFHQCVQDRNKEELPI